MSLRRYGIRWTFAALLTGGALSPLAAKDFPIIRDSQTIVGTFDASSRKLTTGKPYNCYHLDAEKGSVWKVLVEPGEKMKKASKIISNIVDVSLSARQCPYFDNSTIVQRSRHTFTFKGSHVLKLVSGGGHYAVIVDSLDGQYGDYSLTFQREPLLASGGFLKPGFDMKPWMLQGWNPGTTASTAADGFQPGTALRDCDDVCPQMVVLPAGSFTMGSPAEEADREGDEGPRHTVRFAHPFAVGKYEVSFDEYDACVADKGCTHRPVDDGQERGRRPVRNVNFGDAMDYVAWLSQKAGQRYHLLSESEWEYAARAGTDTPWHTGEAILAEDANILNGFKQPVPVGSFAPNAFGLYDMHGNAWEWVLDCADVGYFDVPADGGAKLQGNCPNRGIRGADWTSEPKLARSANRGRMAPAGRAPQVGFRVARSL